MAYKIARIRSKIGFERAFALNKLIFGAEFHEGPETGNVIWLATDATGEAVGFASMRPTVGHPTMAFLSRAGVLSGHRRQGLHRRLIDVRLRASKWESTGFEQVWTYTAAWNLGSANNLIRAGFRLFSPYWAIDGQLYFTKESS